MDSTTIIDFANTASEEIGRHQITFILHPDRISACPYPISYLNWEAIPYGKAYIDKVPSDKRGVYAFVFCHNSDILPQHGYVLYVGLAGNNSTRSLRDRYKDYLNERRVMKRPRIARMIGTWHNMLKFFFAPVDDTVSAKDLKELEKQLIDALLPPFSVGDMSADIRAMRSAFP